MFEKHSPDFLIIGAQNSGCTTLYRYLTANLMIAETQRPDLHFFDHFYQKGSGWYKSQFQKKNHQVAGEATPYYLIHPKIPARVKDFNRRLKLIAMLRNPVERAWEHYQVNQRLGEESLSFREALECEEERLSKAYDPDATDSPLQLYSYKTAGVYHEQIDRWLLHFDSSQLLLLEHDQFFADPWQQVQKVYRFLDVAPLYGTDVFEENQSAKEPKKMPDDDRQYLEDYFREPNRLLAEKYQVKF